MHVKFTEYISFYYVFLKKYLDNSIFYVNVFKMFSFIFELQYAAAKYYINKMLCLN